MPLQHFSWVDGNMGLAPPPGTIPPGKPKPDVPRKKRCSTDVPGCVIEAENQVLGEHLPLVGTPYELDYRSSTVPGRRANYRLNIPLPGVPSIVVNNVIMCKPGRVPECQSVTVPTPLDGIASSAQITVAGRRFTKTSDDGLPGGIWQFEWDGNDRFGRATQGEQWVQIKACIHYPGVGYGTE